MKPSSLEEAIAILQATFPASELQAWAAQPEVQAEAQAHVGLALWIRNRWVYGTGSPLATQLEAPG